MHQPERGDTKISCLEKDNKVQYHPDRNLQDEIFGLKQ